MDFAEATAVTPDPDAPATYGGAVAPGWDIGGNANGGYLLSIAARAMTHAAGRADPVTLTAHYLSPGKPGPLRIETELVKAGKRFATVRAVMRGPEDKAVIAVLGTFGDLDPSASAATRRRRCTRRLRTSRRSRSASPCGASPWATSPARPTSCTTSSWRCTPTTPGSWWASAAGRRGCGAGSTCVTTR